MKRLAVWLSLLTLLAALPGAHSETTATPYLLTEIQRSVQGQLNGMNADLQKLADQWGARSGGDLAKLSDKEIRGGLKSVLKANPIVIDTALVTAHGTLAKIEPAKFRGAEGQTIADQPQFAQLRATGKAVLGPQMRMLEGFEAMDLEIPIRAANGSMPGAISAIFDPRKLIGQYQNTLLKDMPFRLTLLQTDGRILYSSFGDPVFENLKTGTAKSSPATQKVVQRILTEPQGEGIFDMNSAATTDDHAAYWVSVGLHGRELRLVLLSDASRNVPLAKVSRAGVLRDLQKLAAGSEVQSAFAKRDDDSLDDAFIRFLQGHPETYSVQAIDAKGTVFAGQSIGGAPVGYGFSKRRPGDANALAALASGQPAQYESTLLEGGRALFTIVPVKGGAILGIVRYR